MHDHQQPQPPPSPRQQAVGLYYLALNALSMLMAPVHLMLRKPGSTGSHYVTWHFGVGLLAFPLMAEFFPQPGAGVVCWAFALLNVGLMAVHKVRHDPHAHSQFCGVSWLGRSENAYTRWEPLLFAGVGCVLLLVPACLPLGITMVAAAFASAMFHDFLQSRDNAKVRAMRDAASEQRGLMALYHRRFPHER